MLKTSLDISQTPLSYSFVMETDCKLYPYLLAEVFMQIAVFYGLCKHGILFMDFLDSVPQMSSAKTANHERKAEL